VNPDETTRLRQTHEGEEVFVDVITNILDFEREEGDTDKAEAGPSVVGQKIKS
jgi:hypothetical protein